MESWKRTAIAGIFEREKGGWKDGMDHDLEFLKLFGPVCCVCRNHPIPEGGICPECWDEELPCKDCYDKKALFSDGRCMQCEIALNPDDIVVEVVEPINKNSYF